MALLAESFIALIAGMLLNLMPCVLPVLPIKIKTILNTTNHAAHKRVIAAFLYLSGTLVFFLLLGVLTGLLNFFWGSFFQLPLFLWLLVIFFLIAGISLWGNYSIPLPSIFYRINAHHYWAPFISGLLIALLSTPCTGPFLGGLIAYALLQPLIINLWLFGLVGLGMALPVMLLILRPNLLGYIPKQREWANVLKSLLGWILIASAIYFMQSLVPTFWGIWISYITLAIFLICMVYILFKASQWPTRILSLSILIFLMLLLLWPQTKTLDWQPFSRETLLQAKQQKRPLLIEFTADWCINCKVLEKTVYQNQAVLDAATKTNLLSLRIDLTRSNPELEKQLQYWGGRGLPFAVVLNHKGEVIKRLPDIFFATTLAQSILKAGSEP